MKKRTIKDFYNLTNIYPALVLILFSTLIIMISYFYEKKVESAYVIKVRYASLRCYSTTLPCCSIHALYPP